MAGTTTSITSPLPRYAWHTSADALYASWGRSSGLCSQEGPVAPPLVVSWMRTTGILPTEQEGWHVFCSSLPVSRAPRSAQTTFEASKRHAMQRGEAFSTRQSILPRSILGTVSPPVPTTLSELSREFRRLGGDRHALLLQEQQGLIEALAAHTALATFGDARTLHDDTTLLCAHLCADRHPMRWWRVSTRARTAHRGQRRGQKG